MSLFKTSREKRLWTYALIVVAAILSTLTFGRPLQELLQNQNIQAVIFLLGMALTGATILVHGLKVGPAKGELIIWIGLITVCLMLFLRLGLTERSHLIEYSVLAIFIHRALSERFGNNAQNKSALIAFLITFSVGVLDEAIQYFLPNRVYDPVDIFFNGSAAFMALAVSIVLHWAKEKFRKKKID